MTAGPTISRSASGTALVRSPSGTALSLKRGKGALVIIVARKLGGRQHHDSWLQDKTDLESAYAARDPGLSVKLRIMWITKTGTFLTAAQGGFDNTHRPIFKFTPQRIPPEILPPLFVHDPATDVTISEGAHDPPLPVTVPTRMEVYDDELVAVDPSFADLCPSKNDVRPGCRSLHPPKHAYIDAVREFKTEFGFDPSFVLIVTSEFLFNDYGAPEIQHSLGAMGVQDKGDLGIASHHETTIDHLYKRDALISAVRELEDRGIDVELSEYGVDPQFVTGHDEGPFISAQDRLFRELAQRLDYVNRLSLAGRL